MYTGTAFPRMLGRHLEVATNVTFLSSMSLVYQLPSSSKCQVYLPRYTFIEALPPDIYVGKTCDLHVTVTRPMEKALFLYSKLTAIRRYNLFL